MLRSRSHLASRWFARPSILVLLTWVVFLIYYYPRRALFPFDDTYITFRYAYNLAHGYGLAWNPGGAPTEGYTNFLFVLLLTPFSLVTKELVPIAQWISLFANLATGFALYELVRLLVEQRRGKPSMFAGIAVVLLYYSEPYTWINAFSGMETSLFVMLLVLGLLKLQRALVSTLPGESLHHLTTAFVTSLFCALTRPEGGLLAVAILVAAIYRFPAIRLRIARQFTISVALPLVLYASWKYFYFGGLLPNSFYVKFAEQQSIAARDAAGSVLIPAFYAGVRYLVILGLIGVFFLRRSVTAGVMLLWISVLSVFYYHSTLLQPFYFRFLYSLEVLLFVLAAIGLYWLGRWMRYTGLRWVALGLLLWYHIDHTYSKRQAEAWLHRNATFDNRWKEVAGVFGKLPGHEQMTFAWSDVGILPYYSGMKNIDLVGLNTTDIARARSKEEVRSYLLRTEPEFILLPIDHQIATGDSCRTVTRWGHGIIGRIYPELPHDPAFATYKPVSFFRHEAYEILILGDSRKLDLPTVRQTFRALTDTLPLPVCLD